MGYEMGLDKLEEELRASAKAAGKSDEEINGIYLSIYDGSHSDIVRKHLDSGVLANFIKVKEARMMKIPDGSEDQMVEFMFRDPCYEYVLLGACAMSLGCQLPESFLKMLKIVYTEFSVMPDAIKQMRKALFGPAGFKNGQPYDFESKSIVETANSLPNEPSDQSRGYRGLNVIPPGGLLSTGVGDSAKSAVMTELRSKFRRPDVCGGCSIDRRTVAAFCSALDVRTGSTAPLPARRSTGSSTSGCAGQSRLEARSQRTSVDYAVSQAASR